MMLHNPTATLRYERKYHLPHTSRTEVEHRIRLHPAGFREVFAERHVHNLYFDTPDLEAYQANLQGVGQRRKWRLRWYNADTSAVMLEAKVKDGLLGWKEATPLGALDWRTWPAYRMRLAQAVQPLHPTLLNVYRRRYFATSDGHFRLTIDDDMRFAHFTGPHTRLPHLALPDVVVELKYDAALASAADRITQHLPFLMTKFSKYVAGLDYTRLVR